MRELPILPRGVVIIPRSEEMSCPWKDQEIERGWSPLVTMQDTWAKEPSSITSRPKVSGRRSGGSAKSYLMRYQKSLPGQNSAVLMKRIS